MPYLPLNELGKPPARGNAADGRQTMRLSLTGGAIAVILLIAVVVGYGTFFTVYQTSQALVVRLGKPVRVITQPGLNVKVPFIDSVIDIDKRILTIEQPAQEVIASSGDNANAGAGQAGERLVVDAFARYRITDPLKFYQTVGPAGASSQLAILLNSTLRSVLGEATLTDVVRNKREELMARMRDQLDHDAQQFGIHVVDVRIRRADLPEQNSEAVYKRMQTERQREAAEFRAEGSQKAQAIRAKADRDVTVIMADANQQSEQIRGQGDAERNGIFAQAYSQDPGFFAFYRSMQAYEKSMPKGDTNLVLRPGFELLPLFRRSVGTRRRWQAGASPPTPAHPDAHAGATGAGIRRSGCARRSHGTGQIASRSLGPDTGNSTASQRCRIFSPRSVYVFAIEGICLAAFPLAAKRGMKGILAMPDGALRIAGMVSALIGVAIVWLVRG